MKYLVWFAHNSGEKNSPNGTPIFLCKIYIIFSVFMPAYLAMPSSVYSRPYRYWLRNSGDSCVRSPSWTDSIREAERSTRAIHEGQLQTRSNLNHHVWRPVSCLRIVFIFRFVSDQFSIDLVLLNAYFGTFSIVTSVPNTLSHRGVHGNNRTTRSFAIPLFLSFYSMQSGSLSVDKHTGQVIHACCLSTRRAHSTRTLSSFRLWELN